MARAVRGRFRDALRHRDLRLLIGAFLVDQIGSWSYIVVISVYLFDRTHSTEWLAALGICRWGPGLLLASYGGVIADRYQRVTIMVVSALASAAVMAAMAVVVATNAPPALILVLAAASAVALAPYQPAAGALTPEVVGEKDLAAANSLFSALENLVVVLGPGIGGLLLLTGRPAVGVAINAASFAVAAAVISRLRVRSRGGADAEDSTVQQWKAGLSALAAQPVAVAVDLVLRAGLRRLRRLHRLVRPAVGPARYRTQRLQLPAGRGRARRGARRRPRQPAQRRVPAGSGHHGQHLPAGAALPAVTVAVDCARAGCRPAGRLRGRDGHRGRARDHQSAARSAQGDVLGRVLGIFDTVLLAGILLASLATGILLAHADVNVALVAVGRRDPGPRPGRPARPCCGPTARRLRWPSGCVRGSSCCPSWTCWPARTAARSSGWRRRRRRSSCPPARS